MKLNKIVVAVDGSEASQDALDYAVKLARQSNTMLAGFFAMDGGWPDFIGNDWQSSKGARQGFLDYIHKEQEAQAESARLQFADATTGLAGCQFSVVAGEPAGLLLALAREEDTDMLVIGRRVFQVSGRPSLRDLARHLADEATRPVTLFP